MKTDQFPNQSTTPKINVISVNKPYYIYYSHSIGYYNTQTEKEDLKFLRTKSAKVVNPNGLKLGSDIFQYLLKVKQCDAVWYRGYTQGVAFEVLTALAMRKHVFSLETKGTINSFDKPFFIKIFLCNDYINQNLSLFEKIFPDYYSDFLSLLEGDMP